MHLLLVEVRYLMHLSIPEVLDLVQGVDFVGHVLGLYHLAELVFFLQLVGHEVLVVVDVFDSDTTFDFT